MGYAFEVISLISALSGTADRIGPTGSMRCSIAEQRQVCMKLLCRLLAQGAMHCGFSCWQLHRKSKANVMCTCTRLAGL